MYVPETSNSWLSSVVRLSSDNYSELLMYPIAAPHLYASLKIIRQEVKKRLPLATFSMLSVSEL